MSSLSSSPSLNRLTRPGTWVSEWVLNTTSWFPYLAYCDLLEQVHLDQLPDEPKDEPLLVGLRVEVVAVHADDDAPDGAGGVAGQGQVLVLLEDGDLLALVYNSLVYCVRSCQVNDLGKVDGIFLSLVSPCKEGFHHPFSRTCRSRLVTSVVCGSRPGEHLFETVSVHCHRNENGLGPVEGAIEPGYLVPRERIIDPVCEGRLLLVQHRVVALRRESQEQVPLLYRLYREPVRSVSSPSSSSIRTAAESIKR